jgi:hypothetical protein
MKKIIKKGFLALALVFTLIGITTLKENKISAAEIGGYEVIIPNYAYSSSASGGGAITFTNIKFLLSYDSRFDTYLINKLTFNDNYNGKINSYSFDCSIFLSQQAILDAEYFGLKIVSSSTRYIFYAVLYAENYDVLSNHFISDSVLSSNQITGSVSIGMQPFKYVDVFNKYTELQKYYNDGFKNGQNQILDNPNEFNLYTNSQYIENYNKGMADMSSQQYTLTSLMSSIFGGFSVFLGAELLPGVTFGALIAVPLVLGIIYFIIGATRTFGSISEEGKKKGK